MLSHASNFGIQFLSCNIKLFNSFKFETAWTSGVVLKIFDIRFSYKRSYFKAFCLPTKMASETVIRP